VTFGTVDDVPDARDGPMDAIPVPVQAGERARYNMAFIWLICLAAAMGGLLFGYDWVVIGGAKPFFERYFNLTTAEQKG